MPSKKAKLRTASDVISRLLYDHQGHHSAEDIVLGYTDRIEGPMEKSVKDFVSAGSGGDIPEHRILYFRLASNELTREQQILWDRAGRVDRIFGSGRGHDGPIAAETLTAVEQAARNMLRIE